MYLYLKFKVIVSVKLFPSENVEIVTETGTAHCWPLCLCAFVSARLDTHGRL